MAKTGSRKGFINVVSAILISAILAVAGGTLLTGSLTGAAVYGGPVGCGAVMIDNSILTSDVGPCTDSGITIAASHVTLDCQGYKLIGNNDGIPGDGIIIDGQTNVTVKNCDITGFYNGMYINYTTNSRVYGLNIYSNDNNGIELFQSSGNTIGNESVYIYDHLIAPLGTAIYLTSDSNGNVIQDVNIADTNVYSIGFETSADNNVIRQSNIYSPISIYNSFGTEIYENTIGALGTAIQLWDTGGSSVYSNIIQGSDVCVKIIGDPAVSTGNTFYMNDFMGGATAFAQTVSADNYWSYDGKGNYWEDALDLDILDNNYDGYGETGSQYPYRWENGARVGSGIVDDYPETVKCTNGLWVCDGSTAYFCNGMWPPAMQETCQASGFYAPPGETTECGYTPGATCTTGVGPEYGCGTFTVTDCGVWKALPGLTCGSTFYACELDCLDGAACDPDEPYYYDPVTGKCNYGCNDGCAFDHSDSKPYGDTCAWTGSVCASYHNPSQQEPYFSNPVCTLDAWKYTEKIMKAGYCDWAGSEGDPAYPPYTCLSGCPNSGWRYYLQPGITYETSCQINGVPTTSWQGLAESFKPGYVYTSATSQGTCSNTECKPDCIDLDLSNTDGYCSNGVCTCIGPTQPSFCGDGSCNPGETCSTCPADCGVCVTPTTPTEGGGGGVVSPPVVEIPPVVTPPPEVPPEVPVVTIQEVKFTVHILSNDLSYAYKVSSELDRFIGYSITFKAEQFDRFTHPPVDSSPQSLTSIMSDVFGIASNTMSGALPAGRDYYFFVTPFSTETKPTFDVIGDDIAVIGGVEYGITDSPTTLTGSSGMYDAGDIPPEELLENSIFQSDGGLTTSIFFNPDNFELGFGLAIDTDIVGTGSYYIELNINRGEIAWLSEMFDFIGLDSSTFIQQVYRYDTSSFPPGTYTISATLYTADGTVAGITEYTITIPQPGFPSVETPASAVVCQADHFEPALGGSVWMEYNLDEGCSVSQTFMSCAEAYASGASPSDMSGCTGVTYSDGITTIDPDGMVNIGGEDGIDVDIDGGTVIMTGGGDVTVGDRGVTVTTGYGIVTTTTGDFDFDADGIITFAGGSTTTITNQDIVTITPNGPTTISSDGIITGSGGGTIFTPGGGWIDWDDDGTATPHPGGDGEFTVWFDGGYVSIDGGTTYGGSGIVPTGITSDGLVIVTLDDDYPPCPNCPPTCPPLEFKKLPDQPEEGDEPIGGGREYPSSGGKASPRSQGGCGTGSSSAGAAPREGMSTGMGGKGGGEVLTQAGAGAGAIGGAAGSVMNEIGNMAGQLGELIQGGGGGMAGGSQPGGGIIGKGGFSGMITGMQTYGQPGISAPTPETGGGIEPTKGAEEKPEGGEFAEGGGLGAICGGGDQTTYNPCLDTVLFTEFYQGVPGTNELGAYIEIVNPTQSVVDLSNYYITDASDPRNTEPYWDESPSGIIFRFPEYSEISPDEVQVIALKGTDYMNLYGLTPNYEIIDTDEKIYDMRWPMVEDAEKSIDMTTEIPSPTDQGFPEGPSGFEGEGYLEEPTPSPGATDIVGFITGMITGMQVMLGMPVGGAAGSAIATSGAGAEEEFEPGVLDVLFLEDEDVDKYTYPAALELEWKGSALRETLYEREAWELFDGKKGTLVLFMNDPSTGEIFDADIIRWGLDSLAIDGRPGDTYRLAQDFIRTDERAPKEGIFVSEIGEREGKYFVEIYNSGDELNLGDGNHRISLFADRDFFEGTFPGNTRIGKGETLLVEFEASEKEGQAESQSSALGGTAGATGQITGMQISDVADSAGGAASSFEPGKYTSISFDSFIDRTEVSLMYSEAGPLAVMIAEDDGSDELSVLDSVHFDGSREEGSSYQMPLRLSDYQAVSQDRSKDFVLDVLSTPGRVFSEAQATLKGKASETAMKVAALRKKYGPDFEASIGSPVLWSIQRIDKNEAGEKEEGGRGIYGNDETSEVWSITWALAPITPGRDEPANPMTKDGKNPVTKDQVLFGTSYTVPPLTMAPPIDLEELDYDIPFYDDTGIPPEEPTVEGMGEVLCSDPSCEYFDVYSTGGDIIKSFSVEGLSSSLIFMLLLPTMLFLLIGRFRGKRAFLTALMIASLFIVASAPYSSAQAADLGGGSSAFSLEQQLTQLVDDNIMREPVLKDVKPLPIFKGLESGDMSLLDLELLEEKIVRMIDAFTKAADEKAEESPYLYEENLYLIAEEEGFYQPSFEDFNAEIEFLALMLENENNELRAGLDELRALIDAEKEDSYELYDGPETADVSQAVLWDSELAAEIFGENAELKVDLGGLFDNIMTDEDGEPVCAIPEAETPSGMAGKGSFMPSGELSGDAQSMLEGLKASGSAAAGSIYKEGKDQDTYIQLIKDDEYVKDLARYGRQIADLTREAIGQVDAFQKDPHNIEYFGLDNVKGMTPEKFFSSKVKDPETGEEKDNPNNLALTIIKNAPRMSDIGNLYVDAVNNYGMYMNAKRDMDSSYGWDYRAFGTADQINKVNNLVKINTPKLENDFLRAQEKYEEMSVQLGKVEDPVQKAELRKQVDEARTAMEAARKARDDAMPPALRQYETLKGQLEEAEREGREADAERIRKQMEGMEEDVEEARKTWDPYRGSREAYESEMRALEYNRAGEIAMRDAKRDLERKEGEVRKLESKAEKLQKEIKKAENKGETQKASELKKQLEEVNGKLPGAKSAAEESRKNFQEVRINPYKAHMEANAGLENLKGQKAELEKSIKESEDELRAEESKPESEQNKEKIAQLKEQINKEKNDLGGITDEKIKESEERDKEKLKAYQQQLQKDIEIRKQEELRETANRGFGSVADNRRYNNVMSHIANTKNMIKQGKEQIKETQDMLKEIKSTIQEMQKEKLLSDEDVKELNKQLEKAEKHAKKAEEKANDAEKTANDAETKANKKAGDGDFSDPEEQSSLEDLKVANEELAEAMKELQVGTKEGLRAAYEAIIKAFDNWWKKQKEKADAAGMPKCLPPTPDCVTECPKPEGKSFYATTDCMKEGDDAQDIINKKCPKLPKAWEELATRVYDTIKELVDKMNQEDQDDSAAGGDRRPEATAAGKAVTSMGQAGRSLVGSKGAGATSGTPTLGQKYGFEYSNTKKLWINGEEVKDLVIDKDGKVILAMRPDGSFLTDSKGRAFIVYMKPEDCDQASEKLKEAEANQKEERDKLKNEIEDLQKQIAEKQKDLSTLEASLNRLENAPQDLKDKKTAKDNAETKVGELESQLDELPTRSDMESDFNKQIESKKAEIENTKQQTETKKEEYEQKSRDLYNQYHEVQKQWEAAPAGSSQKSELEAQGKALWAQKEAADNDAKQTAADGKSKVESLNGELAGLDSQKTKSLEERDAKEKSLNEQLSKSKEDLKNAEKAFDDAFDKWSDEQLKPYKDELSALQGQLKAKQGRLDELDKELMGLRRKVSDCDIFGVRSRMMGCNLGGPGVDSLPSGEVVAPMPSKPGEAPKPSGPGAPTGAPPGGPPDYGVVDVDCKTGEVYVKNPKTGERVKLNDEEGNPVKLSEAELYNYCSLKDNANTWEMNAEYLRIKRLDRDGKTLTERERKILEYYDHYLPRKSITDAEAGCHAENKENWDKEREVALLAIRTDYERKLKEIQEKKYEGTPEEAAKAKQDELDKLENERKNNIQRVEDDYRRFVNTKLDGCSQNKFAAYIDYFDSIAPGKTAGPLSIKELIGQKEQLEENIIKTMGEYTDDIQPYLLAYVLYNLDQKKALADYNAVESMIKALEKSIEDARYKTEVITNIDELPKNKEIIKKQTELLNTPREEYNGMTPKQWRDSRKAELGRLSKEKKAILQTLGGKADGIKKAMESMGKELSDLLEKIRNEARESSKMIPDEDLRSHYSRMVQMMVALNKQRFDMHVENAIGESIRDMIAQSFPQRTTDDGRAYFSKETQGIMFSLLPSILPSLESGPGSSRCKELLEDVEVAIKDFEGKKGPEIEQLKREIREVEDKEKEGTATDKERNDNIIRKKRLEALEGERLNLLFQKDEAKKCADGELEKKDLAVNAAKLALFGYMRAYNDVKEQSDENYIKIVDSLKTKRAKLDEMQQSIYKMKVAKQAAHDNIGIVKKMWSNLWNYETDAEEEYKRLNIELNKALTEFEVLANHAQKQAVYGPSEKDIAAGKAAIPEVDEARKLYVRALAYLPIDVNTGKNMDDGYEGVRNNLMMLISIELGNENIGPDRAAFLLDIRGEMYVSDSEFMVRAAENEKTSREKVLVKAKYRNGGVEGVGDWLWERAISDMMYYNPFTIWLTVPTQYVLGVDLPTIGLETILHPSEEFYYEGKREAIAAGDYEMAREDYLAISLWGKLVKKVCGSACRIDLGEVTPQNIKSILDQQGLKEGIDYTWEEISAFSSWWGRGGKLYVKSMAGTAKAGDFQEAYQNRAEQKEFETELGVFGIDIGNTAEASYWYSMAAAYAPGYEARLLSRQASALNREAEREVKREEFLMYFDVTDAVTLLVPGFGLAVMELKATLKTMRLLKLVDLISDLQKGTKTFFKALGLGEDAARLSKNAARLRMAESAKSMLKAKSGRHWSILSSILDTGDIKALRQALDDLGYTVGRETIMVDGKLIRTGVDIPEWIVKSSTAAKGLKEENAILKAMLIGSKSEGVLVQLGRGLRGSHINDVYDSIRANYRSLSQARGEFKSVEAQLGIATTILEDGARLDYLVRMAKKAKSMSGIRGLVNGLLRRLDLLGYGKYDEMAIVNRNIAKTEEALTTYEEAVAAYGKATTPEAKAGTLNNIILAARNLEEADKTLRRSIGSLKLLPGRLQAAAYKAAARSAVDARTLEGSLDDLSVALSDVMSDAAMTGKIDREAYENIIRMAENMFEGRPGMMGMRSRLSPSMATEDLEKLFSDMRAMINSPPTDKLQKETRAALYKFMRDRAKMGTSRLDLLFKLESGQNGRWAMNFDGGLRASSVNNPLGVTGGDYNRILRSKDGRYVIMVHGDAVDKGERAASTRAIFDTLLDEEPNLINRMVSDPAEVLHGMHGKFISSRAATDGMTVSAVVIDTQTKKARVVTAGEDVLVFRKSKGYRMETISTTGPVSEKGWAASGAPYGRGVKAFENGKAGYWSKTIDLEDGDIIVTASDGVYEWRKVVGDSATEFGISRLEDAVRQSAILSPEEIIRGIERAIRKHVGSAPRLDDLSMMVAKFDSSPVRVFNIEDVISSTRMIDELMPSNDAYVHVWAYATGTVDGKQVTKRVAVVIDRRTALLFNLCKRYGFDCRLAGGDMRRSITGFAPLKDSSDIDFIIPEGAESHVRYSVFKNEFKPRADEILKEHSGYQNCQQHFDNFDARADNINDDLRQMSGFTVERVQLTVNGRLVTPIDDPNAAIRFIDDISGESGVPVLRAVETPGTVSQEWIDKASVVIVEYGGKKYAFTPSNPLRLVRFVAEHAREGRILDIESDTMEALRRYVNGEEGLGSFHSIEGWMTQRYNFEKHVLKMFKQKNAAMSLEFLKKEFPMLYDELGKSGYNLEAILAGNLEDGLKSIPRYMPAMTVLNTPDELIAFLNSHYRGLIITREQADALLKLDFYGYVGADIKARKSIMGKFMFGFNPFGPSAKYDPDWFVMYLQRKIDLSDSYAQRVADLVKRGEIKLPEGVNLPPPITGQVIRIFPTTETGQVAGAPSMEKVSEYRAALEERILIYDEAISSVIIEWAGLREIYSEYPTYSLEVEIQELEDLWSDLEYELDGARVLVEDIDFYISNGRFKSDAEKIKEYQESEAA